MTVAVAIVIEEEVIVVEEVVWCNPISITNHIRQLQGIETVSVAGYFGGYFKRVSI